MQEMMICGEHFQRRFTEFRLNLEFLHCLLQVFGITTWYISIIMIQFVFVLWSNMAIELFAVL